MNFRIVTKKYAADSEIGLLTKFILKPFELRSPIRQRSSQVAIHIKSLKNARFSTE